MDSRTHLWCANYCQLLENSFVRGRFRKTLIPFGTKHSLLLILTTESLKRRFLGSLQILLATSINIHALCTSASSKKYYAQQEFYVDSR